MKKIQKTADEIEKLVREKAGMIARELEGNPSPKEKLAKKIKAIKKTGEKSPVSRENLLTVESTLNCN